jgi:acetyltransferase
VQEINTFFYPDSIAIVGASNNPGKAGFQVVKNLTGLPYAGKVFPVNPKEKTINGLKCFPSLLAIEEKIDLLIITVPAKGVLEIMEQAAQRGDIKAVTIVSAGFSETKTAEGAALEEKLIKTARDNGIRFFGPNCTGVINTEVYLDTTIEPTVRQVQGGVSIFSQSGAMAGALLLMMEEQPVPLGFSKWAHVGNMSDVNTLDIIDYYGQDDSTSVICLYMEGFEQGRVLMEKAADISGKKAVLVLKVGRNELGAKAAFSHTGSLAGKDEIYDAAFEKCGITRVNDLYEMLDTAKAMFMLNLPKGNRVCILTEAGGPGSMAMDEVGKYSHLQLAHISEEGVKKLKNILPAMALVCEPDGYIDMTAAAMADAHADALDAVLAEPEVDAVILITVPPTFLPPDDVAKALIRKQYCTGRNKPVLTCFLAGKWIESAHKILEENGWPTFKTPEQAVRALTKMTQRSNYLKNLGEG